MAIPDVTGAETGVRRESVPTKDLDQAFGYLLETALLGVALLNRERRFIYTNAAYAKILGLAPDAITGQKIIDLLPDLAEQIQLRLDRSFAGERLSYGLSRPSTGGERNYIVRYDPIPKNEGIEIVAILVEDITERKTFEIASQRLGSIVEFSNDGIIGIDLHNIITSWNQAAEKIFGYTSLEIVGSSVMRLIPAGRQDEENHILNKILGGERVEHFETMRLLKDGRSINVAITASPIKNEDGTIIGVSKVTRDITERKKAEVALRQNEERFRSLFEYAPDGILFADPNSYYLEANPSICQMLGYKREELIGMHASDIVAPGEIGGIKPVLNSIHAGMEHHQEWNFRRKDGSLFPVEVFATKTPDGNLVGMIRDITERKRIEGRFRRLVDSNAQGVLFWNTKGETLGANDAFLKMVGYSKADMAAGLMGWAALTPPEYAPLDQRALEELRRQGYCTPFEKEYLRKDGSRVPVLLGAAQFQDSEDDGVCFVVDLTERKKLEAQYLRAQRMESIGTLAGGVAHDLNNVLAPIMMSVELLKESVRDEEGLGILSTLQQSAQRGADLVRQVLAFARGVDGQRILINPTHIVADLVKVMHDTFPKSIKVNFSATTGAWHIKGDPTQIHQVVLNLCVNARDAMPHGGTLTLAMENVVLDETYAAMNVDVRAGAYLMIKVVDTGMGIPSEIQNKIFEPFFTTKELGQGTGLGLSTTLAIVKSHGGFINVYSEPGKGAKFKVYFPAETSEQVALEAAVEQSGLPRGRGEWILVVDDEEPIRNVAQRTLERFGYKVLTAAHGAEGIAVYVQHQNEVAVVLTDMAMPIMDGAALIVALKVINPAVKIVGSSGLASNGGIAKAIGAGVDHFVPKPYTAEAILHVLDTILRSDRKKPIAEKK